MLAEPTLRVQRIEQTLRVQRAARQWVTLQPHMPVQSMRRHIEVQVLSQCECSGASALRPICSIASACNSCSVLPRVQQSLRVTCLG